jgi:NAD(P)H-quinone oxidoreductase subunit 4L
MNSLAPSRVPQISLTVYALLVFGLIGCLLSGGAVMLPDNGQYADVILFFIIAAAGAVVIRLGAPAAWTASIGTIGAFIALTYFQGPPLIPIDPSNYHGPSFTDNPLVRYLTLAAVLFAIGMYGMVVSRNAVRVLMSIELMLNAVNLNMIAFARYVDPTNVKGQIFAIFILTVAAAEAAVGLAIVLAIYRNMATVDMERFNLLKW